MPTDTPIPPQNHLYRVEKDSMGEIQVPQSALYGAQTQRAFNNFQISGWTFPPRFIQALALIKCAAAEANTQIGQLPTATRDAIVEAGKSIFNGQHLEQFPLDIFQTGSGTSTNMNANEVIAHLASKILGSPVHPNDHVNQSQSSNDVIPSAIHVSTAWALQSDLFPALEALITCIDNKAKTLATITKTGRTHLMDAMPVRFDQELSGWAHQIKSAHERLRDTFARLTRLALGGTAVGTGINAPPDFAKKACAYLAAQTQIPFKPAPNYFEALSAQDTAVECSGQLKTLAVALMKIANDLRWMNSGPLAGLGEISLPALQPGSSIMPGKVNPVIPEAVTMVAAQVIGMDTTITVAGQSGNFQLNVMLPVIAYNVLQSIHLLTEACRTLAHLAIDGFVVQTEQIKRSLSQNPILVTALNTLIGYEKGALIAKTAYQQKRPILDVAAEMTDLSRETLMAALDPARLTEGGQR